MLRKKKSLILAGLFMILLAGGLFIPRQDAAAQKIRIAVMPFKVTVRPWWTWDWDVGEGVSGMLVTELVNSGRFDVVEREELDQILQEQNLAQEGITNPATAARIGRLLGVQLFVFGKVTEFSWTPKTIGVPKIGSYAELRGRCGLDVRLVNVETGVIMAALDETGAKSKIYFKLSRNWGDLSGFSIGGGRFDAHALGKATRDAVKKVAEGIVDRAAGLTVAPVTPTVTPQVTVTPTVIPARIRIAIMPFKVTVRPWWTWDWDVGEGVSGMLVTELVNSGRFDVVEREELDQILQEQNLAQEGITDPATAARIGRLLGVQLFVLGKVTEFSWTPKTIGLPKIGSFAELRGRCGLNVRLVNVETGVIMVALDETGAKSKIYFKLSRNWGDLSGFSIGGGRFDAHTLGKATRDAVRKVAEGIEEKTAGLVPVVIIPEVTPEVTAPGVEGVELLISNISYGQLIEFTKVLRNIAGVREVNRRSFSEGIASLEVKATISTQELADSLYLQDFGTFEVEITRFSPDRLEIEIIEKGKARIREGEVVPSTKTARPEEPSPVKRAEEKEAEATLLPQTFSVEGIWEVTVDSVEFLPGEKNLQFNLLITNLQDKPAQFEIGISFEQGAGKLARRSYLVDNLGNEYPVSKISPKGVSPFGRRQIKIIQHTPLKAHLIFPALKDEPEVVFFYGYFRGFDLTGNRWTKTTEVEIGPITLEKAPVAKKELKVVSLPETLVTEDGNWEVTVDSYQFEEKKIEFTLLVKNLQEKIAECTIDKSGTYLLDELSEEYHNPDISKVPKFPPHMPVKVYVTFPEFTEEVQTVALYLLFKPDRGASGDWIIGPIKLKE